MDVYEIRILRDQSGALIYSAPQPNDLSAIQQAKQIARDTDGIEVWLAMDCIFNRPRNSPPKGLHLRIVPGSPSKLVGNDGDDGQTGHLGHREDDALALRTASGGNGEEARVEGQRKE